MNPLQSLLHLSKPELSDEIWPSDRSTNSWGEYTCALINEHKMGTSLLDRCVVVPEAYGFSLQARKYNVDQNVVFATNAHSRLFMRATPSVLSSEIINQADLINNEIQYSFDFSWINDVDLLLNGSDISPAGPARDSFAVFSNSKLGETAFRPSSHLVSYIARAVAEYTSKSKNSAWFKDNADSSEEAITREFTLTFRRLIATVANRIKHGHLQRNVLASNKQFEVYFQDMVVDRFLVVPEDMSFFLASFCRELKSYLEFGGAVSGDWGCLRLDGHRIIIAVSQPEKVPDSWELATRIK